MTDTTLARRNGAADLAPAGSTWTPADIALIREKVATGTTDAEFKLLLYMAHQYQLDPLLRQIWCVKYGNKPAQIFAGRDGFLAIAHRGGAFDGLQCTVRTEPVPLVVTYWDGKANAEKKFTRDTQFVATATAWRKGAAHPVVVEVWEEEYSTGRDLWVGKPRTMITKVAECQALRKAFNISGLYDPDEIRDAPPAPVATPAGPVNPATGEIIEGTAREVPTGPLVGDETAWAAMDQPLPTTPPPPTDDPARAELYERLRAAGAALGLDSKTINAEVKARYHQVGVRALSADTLEIVVDAYERQAAEVQV